MTFEKVIQVAKMYRDELKYIDGYHPLTAEEQHIVHMVTEMETWGPERKEKAMRWLGFIQGVLWVLGVYDIEVMKRHNMSYEQDENKQTQEQPIEETMPWLKSQG